jgi:hypothetical protein
MYLLPGPATASQVQVAIMDDITLTYDNVLCTVVTYLTYNILEFTPFTIIRNPYFKHDPACEYYLNTNRWFLAQCALPDSCGVVNTELISSSWFGQEVYLCRGVEAHRPQGNTRESSSYVFSIMNTNLLTCQSVMPLTATARSHPAWQTHVNVLLCHDGLEYYYMPVDIVNHNWHYSENNGVANFTWQSNVTYLATDKDKDCFKRYSHDQYEIQFNPIPLGQTPTMDYLVSMYPFPVIWDQATSECQASPPRGARPFPPKTVRSFQARKYRFITNSPIPLPTLAPRVHAPQCEAIRFSTQYNIPLLSATMSMLHMYVDRISTYFSHYIESAAKSLWRYLISLGFLNQAILGTVSYIYYRDYIVSAILMIVFPVLAQLFTR